MARKSSNERITNRAIQYLTVGCIYLVVFGVFALALLCAVNVIHAQDTQQILDARLARLTELNAVDKTDLAILHAVLASRWPQGQLAQVSDAVDSAIGKLTANDKLSAGAVHYFVATNDIAPPRLIEYLKTALPEAGLGDKHQLLCAVRSIGPRASGLQDLVRDELTHSNDIIAIHAASALLRIDPLDAAAQRVLTRYLKSESPEMLWRAADAAAHSGAVNDEMRGLCKKLLDHDDVRVRAAAAFAYWKQTNDADAVLPILKNGLAEEELPLATGFISPSHLGDSHRVYIERILSMMQP